MSLLIASFLAGGLTMLAPCVLSVLPIIIGGSLSDKNPWRPLLIVSALAVSVVLFTLLLKGSTLLITIPDSFWRFVSGTLVLGFGVVMWWPQLWTWCAGVLGLERTQNAMAASGMHKGPLGPILLGASLGPVFTTCSPTYALILAIVLPTQFMWATVNIIVYALGMAIPLLLIGYGGQRFVGHFRGLADPKGWFKRILAIILILSGIAIVTGWDKRVEEALIERGYMGALEFEQSLIKEERTRLREGNVQGIPSTIQRGLSKFQLTTNTGKRVEEVTLKQIVAGGPGKDGIPALDTPTFFRHTESGIQNPHLEEEHWGIVIEGQNETRFYPYSILVWHEIVNDVIDNTAIAVTFCPLCGSAIVFDRNVDNQELVFGVSGLLYQSNMLMFDRATETLWSQIEGRAVVGDMAGKELNRWPMQLMTFGDAISNYPDLRVLSENTGFNRRYDFYPYGDYDNSLDIYFPVQYQGDDFTYHPKELVVATVYEETPLAFIREQLWDQKNVVVTLSSGKSITAQVDSGMLSIQDAQGNELPFYYAQWFSWANHHLEGGVRVFSNQALVWPNVEQQ